MPRKKNKGQRSAKNRRPNVYLQSGTEQPVTTSASSSSDPTTTPTYTGTGATRAHSRAAPTTRRVLRQNIARGELFTMTIPRELRKLGILTAGALLILIVLTFVL